MGLKKWRMTLAGCKNAFGREDADALSHGVFWLPLVAIFSGLV
jgi:hypothetical protein